MSAFLKCSDIGTPPPLPLDNPAALRDMAATFVSSDEKLARGGEMDPSRQARERLSTLCRGLMDVSIKREGYAYFPSVERLPDGWPRGDWEILGFGVDPANTNGRLLFGLTRAFELTGDPTTRDLAVAYARHVMDHSSAYLPDDGWRATPFLISSWRRTAVGSKDASERGDDAAQDPTAQDENQSSCHSRASTSPPVPRNGGHAEA